MSAQKPCPAAPAETNEGRGRIWQHHARRTARQVNLAWWLETLATPLLSLALIGAATLLLTRHHSGTTPNTTLLAAIPAAAVILLAAAVAWRASRRFESPETSLIRIEATMGLHNALSAARAGITAWPAPPKKIHAGLRWHWPRLIIPPLGAIALLAAGLLIPVSAKKTATRAPLDPPRAWQALAREIDHLQQENAADKAYLEEVRKRLDDLQSQEEMQWFSHASLEAGDSLRQTHREESQRVEEELNRAEQALDGLRQPSANPAENQRLAEQFDQAMDALREGAMKPNPDLLEQLRQIDPSQLDKLSPEQLDALREALQRNAEALREGRGQGGCEGDDWSDELLDGEGEGECDGEGDGEKPGSGGVQRGPGHDPNTLGKSRQPLETGEATPLQAKDLSRSTTGDLLELQDGKHQADTSATPLTQGGAAADSGQGGDRVWRDALDPEEQRVMKRFFE